MDLLRVEQLAKTLWPEASMRAFRVGDQARFVFKASTWEYMLDIPEAELANMSDEQVIERLKA